MLADGGGRPLTVADLARLDGLLGRPVQRAVDLRQLSRWRVGGRGMALAEPRTPAEVQLLLRWVAENRVISAIIGDGSNILFDDHGFEGLLIRLGRAMSRIRIDGLQVRAEAGCWVPSFVRSVGNLGLSGLEHAIGIPGSLGGLVMMNGGSQRRGVGSVVAGVAGFDRLGRPFQRDRDACAFRYRASSLQDDQLVLTDIFLELERRDARSIRSEMIAIMASRRRKFPKQLPNCGSVFLSDPAMYAIVGPPGDAIEKAGLKGISLGGAQISPLHANFIVNNGNASSSDILGLIQCARTTVADRTGFLMDTEVRHVGPNGSIRPAHESAAALP